MLSRFGHEMTLSEMDSKTALILLRQVYEIDLSPTFPTFFEIT